MYLSQDLRGHGGQRETSLAIGSRRYNDVEQPNRRYPGE